ncbi:MAG: TIGR01212 family radical SAM protein [Planctomycetia bacterium]|nr:TIGR01212 family radical SAM protein [Planctomycetia bacterium]
MPRIRRRNGRQNGHQTPLPQENKPYRDLSHYYRDIFGCKCHKLCVDGGFTCPNRDGKCGRGGCIFCGPRGAGDFISASGIRNQIDDAMKKAVRKHKAEKFVVYFQNYTNTYAPVEELEQKYDSALIYDSIVGLAIGTRPDCIDEEVAKLLSKYRKNYRVWVELGLQTSDDKTAQRINRGYPSVVFSRAVEVLRRHDIDVVTHLLFGLPGETRAHMEKTVEFVTRHDIQGVKIHSLYIQRDAPLEKMYERGEFEPISLSEFVDWAIYALTHFPPHWVIHRLTGECARESLIAPEWVLQKAAILLEIQRVMEERNLRQGSEFHTHTDEYLPGACASMRRVDYNTSR